MIFAFEQSQYSTETPSLAILEKTVKKIHLEVIQMQKLVVWPEQLFAPKKVSRLAVSLLI